MTIEAVYGIVATVLLYGLYHFFRTLQSAVIQLRRIARVTNFLYENRQSLSSLSTELADTLKGANKINQDAVDANVVLVNEVVKLRESVDRFVSTVVPVNETTITPAQYNQTVMEATYDANYNDLLEQGLDPELAKIRAAAYELDYMATNGLNSNIGIGA